METRRWVNPTQPQTLQIAVWLCYLEAAFVLLFASPEHIFYVFPAPGLLRIAMTAALAGGAFLIANDRKWGYRLALAAALVPLLARLLLGLGISFRFGSIGSTNPLSYNAIGLLFEIALVVLLLHPQSREHERVWFK
ncbi:MAG: hypothetical protein ACRD0A_16690 [Acidimicrobiales bacterium]